MVKVCASTAADLGLIPIFGVDISPGRVMPVTSKLGNPTAILPGAWRYGVSAEAGRPVVSILRLGGLESLICSFYPSVAACPIV